MNSRSTNFSFQFFTVALIATFGIPLSAAMSAETEVPANANVPNLDGSPVKKEASKAVSKAKPGSTLEKAAETNDAAPPSESPAPQAPWQTRPGEQTPKKPVHNGKVVDEEHLNDSDAPKDGYGKTHGVAGEFVFGPSVTLLGFPSPFKFNMESRWRMIGAQFSYGFLPKITVSSASGKLNSWDIRLRAFPFEGAFYLGVAYGKQTITASKDTDVIVGSTSYATTITGDMNNSFFAPHLGWRWTWHSGFFYGLDLGWQFQSGTTTAIGYSVPANLSATIVNQILAQSSYLKTLADVQDTANKLGNQGLPLVTLIQIGWLF